MSDLLTRPSDALADDVGHEPVAAPARTFIPDATGVEVGERRRIRQSTIDDKFNLLGSLLAGGAIASLLFGWFTPMTGAIGWGVVAFLAFIGLYALLVSLRADRQQVRDRVMTTLLYSAGITLFAVLVFIAVYTLARGSEALPHLNFFTQTMELAGPLDPLSMGGIIHAIVGTLIQISIALAITVPLGVTTAVFLNEVGGPFARFVRTIADAMTALPSIVAGLFVYAAIITLITHQRSGFAASLAITVMMLPIVIRASDVVLRLVAGNLREASYALGASRVRTIWHVVLPTAKSGLVTAVILGTARGIGETSPVLLTSGVTAVMNTNPFEGPMISLPLQVFDFVRSPEPNMIARGFGTAAVLIVLVLALFFVARIIGGRGPGVLTDRQRRAAAAASVRDTQRMAHQMADREIEQRASSPVYTFVPERADETADAAEHEHDTPAESTDAAPSDPATPRARAPRTFVNPNFPAATPAAAPQNPELDSEHTPEQNPEQKESSL
jgi:phosphate transport system permease protein